MTNPGPGERIKTEIDDRGVTLTDEATGLTVTLQPSTARDTVQTVIQACDQLGRKIAQWKTCLEPDAPTRGASTPTPADSVEQRKSSASPNAPSSDTPRRAHDAAKKTGGTKSTPSPTGSDTFQIAPATFTVCTACGNPLSVPYVALAGPPWFFHLECHKKLLALPDSDPFKQEQLRLPVSVTLP